MAYVTAAEVEAPGSEWTWPTAISSAEKTALIANAQERIEQVTYEKWDTSGSIAHIVSGDGSDLLELRKSTTWSIVTITEIVFRSIYQNSDNFTADGTTVPANDYSISDSKRSLLRVKPTTVRGGLSGMGPIWLEGHKNYRVTGTFGHVTTPEGIKRATIMLVREMASPGSTSKYTDTVSETFPDGYKYVTAAGLKSGIGGVVPILTGVRAADVFLKDFVRKFPIMAVPG